MVICEAAAPRFTPATVNVPDLTDPPDLVPETCRTIPTSKLSESMSVTRSSAVVEKEELFTLQIAPEPSRYIFLEIESPTLLITPSISVVIALHYLHPGSLLPGPSFDCCTFDCADETISSTTWVALRFHSLECTSFRNSRWTFPCGLGC